MNFFLSSYGGGEGLPGEETGGGIGTETTAVLGAGETLGIAGSLEGTR